MKDREIRLRHIIGERIKNERKQKGWTQERLAEKADMHPTYVGKVERGDKSATLDSLEKVASALELKYVELFKDIQPVTGTDEDKNSVLHKIINKLNLLSLEDQKAALELFDFMFKWKKKK